MSVGLLSPPATTLREKATVSVIDQTGLPLYPYLTHQEFSASSLQGGLEERAKLVDQLCGGAEHGSVALPPQDGDATVR